MATLALGALGAAAGSALLPAGLSILGTTLTGAAIGTQLGAMAGSMIDQALLGASGAGRSIEGPRLSELQITSSTEGAAIPRLYGRARLGGQLIWATNLEEEVVTEELGGGGKGMRTSPSVTQTDYRYYANFAIGLCEGEISGISRVWADGREIALADYTTRLYLGSDTQLLDALIEGKEGTNAAPAYRGLAYIVFDRLPLAEFGNRIPQLSFEVDRSVDDLSARIRGVVMIPGSGEFVYDTSEIKQRVGTITLRPENVHTKIGGTDWTVAVDQLQATLPNVESVSLVVSWFGSSLNAAECTLKPGVDRAEKTTTPRSWSVAGQTRSTAHLVSQVDGRPAYGGTPDDTSVINAITDLKTRGLNVVVSPFILMDVPSSNTLADPYSTASTQPAYPWRGRITVSPASGRVGTPDKSPAAVSAIDNFIGTAQVSHFAITGTSVAYSGPAEWSFRRMILHYAHLAKAAGGIDAFVLGSELRGLTQVRGAAQSYPMVAALVQLAADVRTVLGPSTKIVYAADWSEYFGHQPTDGSGDVTFHLDPLWSSPNIDAIGIDCYWPLSDWRDGSDHLDAQAGHVALTDLNYLIGNVSAGEGYDWYYASDADRAAQVRTSITDGLGKPWIYRYKDIRSWWTSQHYNRVNGIEQPTPTAWTPQSKPFWLMEVGCPAIDKGSNQPNVFVDPKSIESQRPYFSTGARDDTIQRRYLEALHIAFDPTHPLAPPALNPVSSVYGSRMVDLSRLHVYAWDARPTPAFPAYTDVWGDGDNWRLGHWISGRLSGAGLQELVRDLLNQYDFTAIDVRDLSGVVPGFVIDRVMSAREALKPLELAYFFDAIESGGLIKFRHRGHQSQTIKLDTIDLVEAAPSRPLVSLTRGQETELPSTVKVAYLDGSGDYAQRIAEASRSTVASNRVASAALPLVLDAEHASQISDTWLHETWSSRDRAQFALPPSTIALESGDVVTLTTNGRELPYRVIAIGDSGTRDIEARLFERRVYRATPQTPRLTSIVPPPPPTGPPLALLLDIPPLRDDESSQSGYVAAAQLPWPGSIAVWQSPEQSGFRLKCLLTTPATTGIVTSSVGTAHPWRLDHGSELIVALDRGALSSTTRTQLLAGSNAAAIEIAPNIYEILQFESADLIAPQSYRLTTLLRGQRGTEGARAAIPLGARFVLLDSAVRPVPLTTDELNLEFHWKIGAANRDIGDTTYFDQTHTFRGVGLAPLSPVHIRATRASNGDLSVTWIRRTRSGGDSWEATEVPLGEESESYAIDIRAGAVTKRTLTSLTPSAIYTVADQINDFGSIQPTVTVAIAQVSPTVGRGALTTATV